MRRHGLWLIMLVLLMAVPIFAESDHTQDEIDLGREVSQKFESKNHIITGDQTARLRRIEAKLVPATERTNLPYQVKEVDGDDINAITFPGGYIYVFKGLLEQNLDDDELAGVLGHESAHAALSHGYKRLEEISLLDAATRKLLHHSIDEGSVSKLMNMLLLNGVGRRFEDQADYMGVQYANKAGFEPHGLLRVLQLFVKLEGERSSTMARLMATHPPATERVARVKKELREMGIDH